MEQASTQIEGQLRHGVSHLRSLTGLRFVAAFVVFASHAQIFLFPQLRHVALGGPAVSFFFVLSGFILTYVYNDRLTWKGVPRFWFSRWARLWPNHFVCLIIVVMLSYYGIGKNPNGNDSVTSFIAQLLLVQAWLPLDNWFLDFNAVSWSISTELFFYLSFPFLLLGKRKHYWIKFLCVLALAFITLKTVQWYFDSGNAHESIDKVSSIVPFPLVRILEFALGIGVCLLMKRMGVPFTEEVSSHRLQYVIDTLWETFAIMLVVATWLLIVQTRITNFMYRSPEIGFAIGTWCRISGGLVAYAFLIFTFARCRGFFGQVMSTRFAVWLGEISFSFYLIHQIILIKLNGFALNDIQFSILSLLLALLASALLYRTIEIPCRNALLTFYDRKKGALKVYLQGWKSVMSTTSGRIQLSGIIVIMLILWMRPVDTIKHDMVLQIQTNSPTHLKHVRFEEEAVLMGCEARKVERGVFLRMGWKRERSWSRHRFLHICDANGNIVGQAPYGDELFQEHKPYQPFVEEVLLSKRKLKGAAYVAVGFWSEELQSTKVASPDADMNGFRLKLFDIQEIMNSK